MKVKLIETPEIEEGSCRGCYLENQQWKCPSDINCGDNGTILLKFVEPLMVEIEEEDED